MVCKNINIEPLELFLDLPENILSEPDHKMDLKGCILNI